MRRPLALALALSSLFLTSCGDDESRPSTPTTSAAASGTVLVPWADLPATHPEIPSTRVRARPDPAVARAARPCRADDLVLTRISTGAAAGTMVKNLRFSLATGRTPCAVSGRPALTVRTVEGVTVPGRLSTWTPYWHPVLLTPTNNALVQLVWPSACYAPSGQSSASLTYAGRTWSVPMGPLSRSCHFEPDRPLLSMGITSFLPPHRRPARRVTAYNRVATRGPHVLSAHLGRVTTFRVTLVAHRDVPLDPCPDYRIGATSGEGRRYALNCAAVPWRDAQDHPYLPAHRPVTFEMQFDPVETTAKFFWNIVAPGSPPYIAGLVRVR